MPEALHINEISNLHLALYNRLKTITGIPGVRFLGFDSSRVRAMPAAKVGYQISVSEMQVDRNRALAAADNRLLIPSETTEDVVLDGVTYTIPEEYTVEHPMPVNLTYEVDVWCHDAQQQALMEQKLYQKFPERGALYLTVEDQEGEFPIMLTGIQPLDDLAENIRERIYIYRVEAWIKSWIPDATTKPIKSSTTGVYEGTPPEDPDDVQDPLIEVTVQAD